MIPETLERAPQRRKVYEFIKAQIAAGRPFPTTLAICVHMGWSRPASALATLKTLAILDGVLVRSRSADGGKRFKFSLPEGAA